MCLQDVAFAGLQIGTYGIKDKAIPFKYRNYMLCFPHKRFTLTVRAGKHIIVKEH